MLNKNEIIRIVIITIILGFSISLIESVNKTLYSTIAIFCVILVNVFAKKIASFYLDLKTEIDIWEIKKFGWKSKDYFKKPFQIGAFLPILTSILTFGYFIWLGSLTFDSKPETYRTSKRYGLYTFSEVTEYHIALIAAAGIITNLFFAIVGYLLGYTEFSGLNILFAFFNMIPLSNLDGNKIFFGSLILWSFLVTLTLVGVGYVIFLV